MADLKAISELAYNKVFPKANAQTPIHLEEFIETAKVKYAFFMWRLSKEQKRAEGEWEIPSSLFREAILVVKNKEADISELGIFRSFDGDMWLGMLGDLNSDCNYIRQTVNTAQILNDPDYHGNSLPYYPAGNKLKFPLGAHSEKVNMTYASNGEDVDGSIPIDDAIGSMIFDALIEVYSNKQPVDETNDDNANQ